MTAMCELSATRRAFLGTAGALFAWSRIPRAAAAPGGRDPRFVCIVLRGAMDGLSAVPPVGDPDYARLREQIALQARDVAGQGSGAFALDGFFGLHPAMPNVARMFHAGQASVVHAVATGYRERSHFDGQDVLESGQSMPGRVTSGWLNRLAQALPAGERVGPPADASSSHRSAVLGVGGLPPLVVRGSAPVFGWAPPSAARASADTAQRVLDLYAARDAALADRFRIGLETNRLALNSGVANTSAARPGQPGYMRYVAEGAARIMAADDGPRLAALVFDGWDTHANEGGATGRLADLLAGLDGALAAFESAMAARWRETVVLVATEFGRAARVNGTVGTDHGTGTASFLVGGAVRGGRVIADWPGLTPAALLDGRDLLPTTDLRGVVKGVLHDLFEVSAASLATDVFPGTEFIEPARDLVLS